MQEVLSCTRSRRSKPTCPLVSLSAPRADDGSDEGEFSPLGFRRACFALLRVRAPSGCRRHRRSRASSWDAASSPRGELGAAEQDKASSHHKNAGREHAHFDRVGTTARIESAVKQILGAGSATIGKTGETAVLMGDFNSPATSGPCAAIVEPARP